MSATEAVPVPTKEQKTIRRPAMPLDDITLAEKVLVETEAAERARIRAIEAVVIGLALACLYILAVPGGRMLTVGDYTVIASLAIVSVAFFAFYEAAARSHGEVADYALDLARRLEAARQPDPVSMHNNG